MKKILFWITLFSIALSACTPSQSSIQTAIALTAAANPTATVTFTQVPTATPTITSTPTPEPTVTPTPDTQIIAIDPQKFLPTKNELPLDAMYYLPNETWTSINTNEEVISARGIEEGRKYVIETGRVTGWWVAFARGTRAVQAPDELSIFVGQYKTAEGAQLSVTKFNNTITDPAEYKMVNQELGIGDVGIIYKSEKITSGGDKQVALFIEYTYRNMFVDIYGWGLEKDVSLDYLKNLGEMMLEKLKAAELSPAGTLDK